MLLSLFNSYSRNNDNLDLVGTDITKFMENNYPHDTIDELKNRISHTEMKKCSQKLAWEHSKL